MRLQWLRQLSLMTLGIFAALTVGCGSSRPASFYTLNAMQGSTPVGNSADPQEEVTIAVGPVVIPDYLNRPEIVTRSAPNALKLADLERWGEPLEKGITRVLAENLSLLLSTERITTFPGPVSIPSTYQVVIEITQLEPVQDGEVMLRANWTVFSDRCERVISMHRSRITTTVDAPGFEGIAAATSRSIEGLSREIADALRLCMLN
jgi:uncharacterized protein